MGLSLGQALAGGNAGMQQQGGITGCQLDIDHQTRLGPQPDQARFTGATSAAQTAQHRRIERSQGSPGGDARLAQTLDFAAEVSRKRVEIIHLSGGSRPR